MYFPKVVHIAFPGYYSVKYGFNLAAEVHTPCVALIPVLKLVIIVNIDLA
jgi:hypothetical protein